MSFSKLFYRASANSSPDDLESKLKKIHAYQKKIIVPDYHRYQQNRNTPIRNRAIARNFATASSLISIMTCAMLLYPPWPHLPAFSVCAELDKNFSDSRTREDGHKLSKYKNYIEQRQINECDTLDLLRLYFSVACLISNVFLLGLVLYYSSPERNVFSTEAFKRINIIDYHLLYHDILKEIKSLLERFNTLTKEQKEALVEQGIAMKNSKGHVCLKDLYICPLTQEPIVNGLQVFVNKENGNAYLVIYEAHTILDHLKGQLNDHVMTNPFTNDPIKEYGFSNDLNADQINNWVKLKAALCTFDLANNKQLLKPGFA